METQTGSYCVLYIWWALIMLAWQILVNAATSASFCRTAAKMDGLKYLQLQCNATLCPRTPRVGEKKKAAVLYL